MLSSIVKAILGAVAGAAFEFWREMKADASMKKLGALELQQAKAAAGREAMQAANEIYARRSPDRIDGTLSRL